MSADNGIYVGIFSDGKIRVTHAQAIEDIFYPHGENAFYITSLFGRSREFNSLDEAYIHAHKLENDILESDFPVLEYGVNTIRFEKPFAEYEKLAKSEEYDTYGEKHGK